MVKFLMVYIFIYFKTSIAALKFKDGIVFAADSKTTTGAYVSSRASEKINKLTDNIYILRCGSAADSQTIQKYCKHYIDFLSLQTGYKPSVKSAAHIISTLIYANRGFLSSDVIIGGIDDELGIQIYQVMMDGFVHQQEWALDGSGTEYVMGLIDHAYKPNMSKEECCQLATKLIELSIGRDSKSGGIIRYVIMTKDGVEKKYVPYESIQI